MSAPAFWWRPRGGVAALALAPAALVYGTVAARRLRRPGRAAGVPVVCVGNLVVGGAGKTPTALALAGWLEAQGESVAFLSRGYGGAGRRAPVRVDPAHHRAADVGDEPLLLARAAPCYVGADRVAAAAEAVREGASVLVMDDGLQNRGLAKTLTVAVVDGGVGFGNGRVMPAGPLRAPLASQWPLVDLLLVIGPGEAGDRAAAEAGRHGVAVTRAALAPERRALAALRGQRLVAFSGIGRPGKFFETLTAAGLDVLRRLPFPDHHPYSERDLAALTAAAEAERAQLVTTEKDAVRLPPGFPCRVLPVSLLFDDPDAIETALAQGLNRPR